MTEKPRTPGEAMEQARAKYVTSFPGDVMYVRGWEDATEYFNEHRIELEPVLDLLERFLAIAAEPASEWLQSDRDALNATEALLREHGRPK